MESLAADGELKAPSLGSRIFRVGIVSGLGPEDAEGARPFVVGKVAGLGARTKALPFFLDLGPGGGGRLG